jgi:predicted HicB family RNase H-like nuclease
MQKLSLTIRVDEADLAQWRILARQAGKSTSAWIRAALNGAEEKKGGVK